MSLRLSINVLVRVKIIELFTSFQSIVVRQRKFRTYYSKKRAPTIKSIERIVAKFTENGSVTNQQLERQDDRDPSVITTILEHLLKRIQD